MRKVIVDAGETANRILGGFNDGFARALFELDLGVVDVAENCESPFILEKPWRLSLQAEEHSLQLGLVGQHMVTPNREAPVRFESGVDQFLVKPYATLA